MNTPLKPDERAAINEFAMTQGKPVADITDQLAQALDTIGHLAGASGTAMAHIQDVASTALEAYRASKEGEKVEYRMLEQGETIQEGDQYIPFHRNGWEPVKDGSTGLPLSSFNVGYYRRPIRAT